MLDEELGAAHVADEGPALWIVHGVREVAHEGDVLSVLRHLPEPEGPSRHAHIHVHAHEDNVVDVARFEEVPDLDAGVADRVLLLVDAEDFDLLRPRGFRIQPLRRELRGPFGVFVRIVVLAAAVIVDAVVADA